MEQKRARSFDSVPDRMGIATLALAVAAGVTAATAFFADESGLTAGGAQVADTEELELLAFGIVEGRDLGARLAEIFGEHLSDAVGERPHPLQPKAHRAAAADTGKLVDDFLQPLSRGEGRGHTER